MGKIGVRWDLDSFFFVSFLFSLQLTKLITGLQCFASYLSLGYFFLSFFLVRGT